MNVIVCFTPVILFLIALLLLDSFKLVRTPILLACLLWSVVGSLGSYELNTLAVKKLHLDFDFLARYVAPIIEETLKALFIYYLIIKKKIGFMVDAAIYGFAIGAGFSLVENVYYLMNSTPDYNLITWIIRGFGTAIMHGGCTALLAVIFMAGISRSWKRLPAFLPGLLVAIVLHAGFNYFPLNPVIQTLCIVIVLPIVFLLVFRYSSTRLQQWLEIEFNSEAELLSMIRKGQLRSTKAGAYLLSLKERFAPATILDMYCYIGLYLELSIKAKRNLMLKENDFPIIIEEDTDSKLLELNNLRKQIGTIGEIALSPLIRMNYRNLWQLNQLK